MEKVLLTAGNGGLYTIIENTHLTVCAILAYPAENEICCIIFRTKADLTALTFFIGRKNKFIFPAQIGGSYSCIFIIIDCSKQSVYCGICSNIIYFCTIDCKVF